MPAEPATTRALSLLAGSVAGCRLPVVAAAVERTYCDGERIVVPEEGHELDAVVLHAALLRAGSLDPALVVRLGTRPSRRARYLVLEAARAVGLAGTALPRRLERRVRAVYDGTVETDARASLRRARSSSAVLPDPAPWMGEIRPGRVLRRAGSVRFAHAAPGTAREPRPPADQEPGEDDGERSRVLETLLGAFTDERPGARRRRTSAAATDDGADGEGEGDEIATGRRRTRAARPSGRPGAAGDRSADPPGRHDRRYPEWDRHRARYRAAWCDVAEVEPAGGAPAVEGADDADRGRDPRLVRALARLGRAPERHRRRVDGDDIDLTAVVELAVDRRTGRTGDARVYTERRPTARDLGVLVLLDASGSTGDAGDPESIFEAQREVAARLTAAFTAVGDRVACFGFRSHGRGHTRFLRVKDFDDAFDLAARRRLARLEPGGFTRLGAVVRHGTHVLVDRAGTSSTMLVVVGDGLPYDDAYEGRYAEDDCARAFREAAAVGVACACVCVRSSTAPEVIDRVWGHVEHCELDRPEQVARGVGPVFAAALRRAAATRRRTAVRADDGA